MDKPRPELLALVSADVMHGLVLLTGRTPELARDRDGLAESPQARGNADAKAGEGKSPILGFFAVRIVRQGPTHPQPLRGLYKDGQGVALYNKAPTEVAETYS